jgi:very-short-patch-repair endonuclease
VSKSELEELLAFQIRAAELPEPEREYRFYPERRFRADFAFPKHKVLVEIHGGLYVPRSGHRTAKGVLRDMTKSNLAALGGWMYLQFSAKQVQDGSALNIIETVLKQQPHNAINMLWTNQ